MEADDGFILVGRSARRADADEEEWILHLGELSSGVMGEEDADGHWCSGDGDAIGVIHDEALLELSGLVEDDGLGADNAALGIGDGEGDRGDEG